MVKVKVDPEIIAYQNQVSMLEARNKDITNTNRNLANEIDKIYQDNQIVFDNALSLCTTILAKDKKEMVLGRNYSWGDQNILELLKKSKKSYIEYCEKQVLMMEEILDRCEERGGQIMALKDQIKRLLEKEKQEEALAKLPQMRNQEITDEEISQILEESDNEISDFAKERIPSISKSSTEEVVFIGKSIPVLTSNKKQQMYENAKQEAIMAHIMDLKDMEKKITELMWGIIDEIGHEGTSRSIEIENNILKANEDWKRTKLHGSIQSLYKMEMLTRQIVNTPLSPRLYLYKLSEIGKRLYAKRHGKETVVSEMERIVKEHDNCEHGYGILNVQSVLEASGEYESVSIFNRGNAIKLDAGKSYVPDLVAKTKKYVQYMEYERGLHTQSDFNAKCNKMTQVTRFLYFITPNRAAMEKLLMPKIERWIKDRGQKSLQGVNVYVTTVLAMKNSATFQGPDGWPVVYKPSESVTPIKGAEK